MVGSAKFVRVQKFGQNKIPEGVIPAQVKSFFKEITNCSSAAKICELLVQKNVELTQSETLHLWSGLVDHSRNRKLVLEFTHYITSKYGKVWGDSIVRSCGNLLPLQTAYDNCYGFFDSNVVPDELGGDIALYNEYDNANNDMVAHILENGATPYCIWSEADTQDSLLGHIIIVNAKAPGHIGVFDSEQFSKVRAKLLDAHHINNYFKKLDKGSKAVIIRDVFAAAMSSAEIFIVLDKLLLVVRNEELSNLLEYVDIALSIAIPRFDKNGMSYFIKNSYVFKYLSKPLQILLYLSNQVDFATFENVDIDSHIEQFHNGKVEFEVADFVSLISKIAQTKEVFKKYKLLLSKMLDSKNIVIKFNSNTNYDWFLEKFAEIGELDYVISLWRRGCNFSKDAYNKIKQADKEFLNKQGLAYLDSRYRSSISVDANETGYVISEVGIGLMVGFSIDRKTLTPTFLEQNDNILDLLMSSVKMYQLKKRDKIVVNEMKDYVDSEEFGSIADLVLGFQDYCLARKLLHDVTNEQFITAFYFLYYRGASYNQCFSTITKNGEISNYTKFIDSLLNVEKIRGIIKNKQIDFAALIAEVQKHPDCLTKLIIGGRTLFEIIIDRSPKAKDVADFITLNTLHNLSLFEYRSLKFIDLFAKRNDAFKKEIYLHILTQGYEYEAYSCKKMLSISDDSITLKLIEKFSAEKVLTASENDSKVVALLYRKYGLSDLVIKAVFVSQNISLFVEILNDGFEPNEADLELAIFLKAGSKILLEFVKRGFFDSKLKDLIDIKEVEKYGIGVESNDGRRVAKVVHSLRKSVSFEIDGNLQNKYHKQDYSDIDSVDDETLRIMFGWQDKEGNTAFHILVANFKPQNSSLVERLKNIGAGRNIANFDGTTVDDIIQKSNSRDFKLIFASKQPASKKKNKEDSGRSKSVVVNDGNRPAVINYQNIVWPEEYKEYVENPARCKILQSSLIVTSSVPAMLLFMDVTKFRGEAEKYGHGDSFEKLLQQYDNPETAADKGSSGFVRNVRRGCEVLYKLKAIGCLDRIRFEKVASKTVPGQPVLFVATEYLVGGIGH